MISYQGKLLNSSGIPVNGNVAMTFRLYDAAVGGNTSMDRDKKCPGN